MEMRYNATDSVESNATEEHSDQTRESSDMKFMTCERSHQKRKKRSVSTRTDRSNVSSATPRRSRWPERPADEKRRTFRRRERFGLAVCRFPSARRGVWRRGRARSEESGPAAAATATLPVSEEEFLQDMLSSRPRFQSRAQRRPLGYWERAAAVLPAYRGPWRPGRRLAEHDGGDERQAAATTAASVRETVQSGDDEDGGNRLSWGQRAPRSA